jgi:hypothetical protein
LPIYFAPTLQGTLPPDPRFAALFENLLIPTLKNPITWTLPRLIFNYGNDNNSNERLELIEFSLFLQELSKLTQRD